MGVRRFLPYIVGLIVLAFALGSLPRGSANGSILFQSYWLLYLVYLGPVATLGVTFALIIVIGLYWRDLGTGIGFGMARRRMLRRKHSRLSYLIAGFFWGLALGVLIVTRGTIFNPNQIQSDSISKIVGASTGPPNPIPLGVSQTISSLVDNSWFSFAFLGLLVVGGLVVVQAIRVSMKETRELYTADSIAKREEGLLAVQQAIKILDDARADPRSRIISCYQHLIATVSRLGAPVSDDLTARELETAIRSTFLVEESATSDLTKLFEEARYSLHEIVDEDAVRAYGYLKSIAEELRVKLDTEIEGS